MDQPRTFAVWPTAPANNETIIIFNTHAKVPTGGTALVQPSLKRTPGALQAGNAHPVEVEAIDVTWHRHNKASAANGLRAYALDISVDPPVWRETDVKNSSNAATIGSGAAIQVPILAAPAEWWEFFDIARYTGFALEYTAGADNPEEWNGTIVVHKKRAAVHR